MGLALWVIAAAAAAAAAAANAATRTTGAPTVVSATPVDTETMCPSAGHSTGVQQQHGLAELCVVPEQHLVLLARTADAVWDVGVRGKPVQCWCEHAQPMVVWL